MKYLVVIPTYNEKENIEALLTRINALSLGNLDILIVDDNSPDKTAEEVLSWQKKQNNLFLLVKPEKNGLGKAYQAGFEWGLKRGYNALIQMDADLSHDPVYLPVLVIGLSKADFVVGSRYCAGGTIKNWGLVRRFLSWGGNVYARAILGVKIKDLTGGFNVWRAEVLKKIYQSDMTASGYSFQVELKYRALKNEFKAVEIPITFLEREKGKSKMSWQIVGEAIMKIIYLRLSRPK